MAWLHKSQNLITQAHRSGVVWPRAGAPLVQSLGNSFCLLALPVCLVATTVTAHRGCRVDTSRTQHRPCALSEDLLAKAEPMLPGPWGSGHGISTLAALQNTLLGAIIPTPPASPDGPGVPGSPALSTTPYHFYAIPTVIFHFPVYFQ